MFETMSGAFTPLSTHRRTASAYLWYASAILTGVLVGATLALWPATAHASPIYRNARTTALTTTPYGPPTPLLIDAPISARAHLASHSHTLDGGDVTGQIADSASGAPLQGVSVSVLNSTTGDVIISTTTDAFGRFTMHNIKPGSYVLSVHLLGFRSMNKPITITNNSDVSANFHLPAVAAVLQGQTIQASVPLTVNTRTGTQQFQQDQYHGTPTTTTSQIIQQSVAGAARAPMGEVHIRGQHAEYSYYVDGVPVPSGISGSLNELFDPSVVDQIDFITGAWDAEYGGKNAAVINVETHIPTGTFHANISGFAGSFNTNGQSANVSGNSGRFGYFLSASRQSTDMRQEPVMFDTLTYHPINFHNHGEDLYSFGKLQYTASANDIVTLEGNWSRTRFQVPYDSTGGTYLNDNQQDINTFINLGWHHRFSHNDSTQLTDTAASTSNENAGLANELFAGVFYRYGTLDYTPDANDDAQFIFYPDTETPYNLSENRNFSTYGVKADYTYRPKHGLEFKLGTLSSITTGHEDFTTIAQDGSFGPASNSDLKGHDIGVYAQTAYSPVEEFEIRTGLRYDSHNAPFAGTQSQLSPRIRLSYFPNTSNTLYVYFGRQFIPTNIEDLRSITSIAQADTVTVPTLPERDNFYEAGYIHRFPGGVVAKLDGYHKESNPGIDDNTVPGSSIVTDVNIEHVRINGVETAIEVRPKGPLSGYVNLALNHAYGYGTVTGGFFPSAPPSTPFDLDHDQRVSGVISATYAPSAFYLSATGIYGSGLTNGVDATDCGCSYGTSLFDFNSAIHVKPSFIGNVSAGYSFVFGETVVRPELFVDNVFNKQYLLKGAFFSGASVGRPRSVQFRVNVGV